MMFKVCTLLLLIQLGLISCSQYNLDVLMPDVSPKNKDTYLCHKFKIDQDQAYITKFHPNSTKEIAHHMLLFGCHDVSDQEVWNCGEMHKTDAVKDKYEQGPVCKNAKQSIIYAWAMDAPELTLPKDVAFKVGRNTDIKYLVLQVHYANVDSFLKGETDNSGVVLTAQDEPVENVAGVYLLETGGYMEPHSEGHFETACQLREGLVMHPFAFRTHAHKLGIVNSGYVIKTDPESGEQSWTEIGRRSPQLPQMFYPATNKIEVKKGDVLAARCTMNNYLDHTVSIGSTGDDEMCNFYVMYYVKGDKILDNNICMSYGPPAWSFKNFKTLGGKTLDLSKIPEDIGQVPEDQEQEMSDMHGMHGMVHEETKNSKVDKIKDMLKTQQQSEESQEETHSSEEVSNDEYENFLSELEKEYQKEYLYNKLVDKLARLKDE